MTSIVTRMFSPKLWRDRSILRPFVTYLPMRKLSANAEQQQEIADASENSTEMDPLTHPDFFHVHNLFTVKDLFDARVHYGHKDGSLNEYMKPFIFGSRLGHLIFDLDETANFLRQALNFTAHVASRGGIILFLAKNPQISYLVECTAKECREYAHTRSWRIGTFTNSENTFGVVTRLPDLCIFLNTMESVIEQHQAIVQAAKMAIPTVGIVDSNCDPRLISYPVPGNDDTPCAIQLYCKLFKEAILRGKNHKNAMLVKNET